MTSRMPVSGTANSDTRRRPFLLDIYATSVGKKYAMGVTGLMLLGFVFFHMIGNLKMFLGAADLNSYAEFLQRLLYPLAPHGVVLWILRGGLLLALSLHLHAAWSLTVLNRKSRSVKYQSARDYQVASFASRTMRLSGLVVLAFLVWHLADLTFGAVNPYVGTMTSVGAHDGEQVKDVYGSVIYSFQRWPVSLFYIFANVLLGTHLFHGIKSAFQSLGWSSPKFNYLRRVIATGFSTLVVVGNVSFPVAVLAGIIN
jgi:succinate dehydrogenase / fumarate reductase cytochrome b subunit